MKVNFKALGKVALGVAEIMVPQIHEVEERAKQVAHLKGDAKKTAAIELTKAAVKAAEDISGHDLVNDPEFHAVLGDLNDVLVRLHNVAAKTADPAFVPASAAQLGMPAGSTGE